MDHYPRSHQGLNLDHLAGYQGRFPTKGPVFLMSKSVVLVVYTTEYEHVSRKGLQPFIACLRAAFHLREWGYACQTYNQMLTRRGGETEQEAREGPQRQSDMAETGP
jgi:hypothetical protein